jgi:pyruvate dehydrogenase E1 component
MALIVDRGMREMLVEQRDVFYYVTLMNENYAQPDLPPEAHEGVIRGGWRCARLGDATARQRVSLLASGAILTEALKAGRQLAADGIPVDVYSITSWSELARDGQACAQRALAGDGEARPHVTQLLAGSGPVIAASDYVRAVPESIRAFVPAGRRYLTLGTDGFGRSDTRAALRAFFGVDAASIAQAAQVALGA